MPQRLRSRGARTIELPFLATCALQLLNHRHWILGVRYEWHGVEFDLVTRDPGASERIILVEAKYRSDRRAIRPSEIEAFRKRLNEAFGTGTSLEGRAVFMTNSRLSQLALDLAKRYKIRVIPEIPTLFRLNENIMREHARSTSTTVKRPKAAAFTAPLS